MKKQKKKSLSVISYLKSASKKILFIIMLFFLSIIIGFLNADSLSSIINPYLKELIEKTSDLKGIELTLFIFQNNALVSLIGIFSGIFLGIFPIITSIVNGVVLGYVLERTAQLSGFIEWWRLFPHGIFELPAVFLSLGIGLKIGYDLFRNYLLHYLKNNKKLIWIPLLIILLFIVLLIPILSSQSLLLSLQRIITAIIIYLILFSSIIIIITSILDKKLRKKQLTNLKTNISGSFKVFIFIILPLLIIAAIIEGLLITLI